MKTVRRAGVSALLAGTMLAALLSGCGEKKADGTAAALTINGETVNMGSAEFYLRLQQAESTTMMINYGLIQEGAAFWDGQYTAATSSQEAETYGSNMKESARDSIVEAVVLRQHFGDYDLTFPEDLDASAAETAAAVMAENADAMAEIGATEEDVAEVLRLMAYRNLMFDSVTADTDTEVSDEEAAQTTITYARASVKTTDSETNEQVDKSDEEKGVLHTELATLLEQAVEADDPEADLTAMAKEIDETNITVSSRSFGSDDTTLPDEVKDVLADLEDGQFFDEVIETEDYYYIVRLDKMFDEEKTEQQKETIAAQRLQDAFAAQLDTWTGEAEVTESDAWKALTVTDAHTWVQATPEAESSSAAETTDSTAVSSAADSTAASSAADSTAASSAAESTSSSAADSAAASSAAESASSSAADSSSSSAK